MPRFWVGVAVIVLGARALPALAQAETPQAFLARLVQAIGAHDRRAVAQMLRYPLRVHHPVLGRPIPLDNAASTIRMYDLLFTPEMRCAIEQARPAEKGRALPKYPLLTAPGVVTIGNGVLVAERAGSQFKISRMSVIGSPEPRRSGVPASARAVDLQVGGTRQFTGRLAGEDYDRFTVTLTKGTFFEGRLERFRGLDATFRVTDASGNAVDARADGRRVWSRVVPASGAYRVDIVRRAPFCDPSFTYLLTLSAR